MKNKGNENSKSKHNSRDYFLLDVLKENSESGKE